MRILETKTQNAHSSKALFSARAVCMPLILIAALVPAACTSSASTKAMEEQAAKERAEQLQAVYARRSESTLAILPFTGAQEAEQGETIAELFSFNKDLNSAFTLIPRTSINIAIRNEQGFQMTSSMTDPDTSAALGKQLGAKYVLAGAITRLGNENLLIISILHVEDLRQIAGDLQTYGTIEEIRGKLPNMARNIVNALIADSSKLPLLAVPPVQWLGSYDNSEADIMAQALAMYLVQSGKYAVYPRTKSLEKVQEEYNNQFGGDVADEYLPHISMGDNPRLVLSVTARKLGNDNMFNAAIINLETGAQEGGESVDYQNLNDGIRVMEKLALKLTGQEERLAAEQERRSHTVNSASSFAQAISAINNDNAGGAYTITLKGDFSAAPVSFTENASKTITIKGDGIARTISNNGGKALFTVPQGISLVLDSGATLDGNGKTASLVSVSGGTLVMKNGSTVRRAKASGVYVAGGTFTMEGGIISGNTARPGSGGGVYVASTATFTMEGGTISGNTAGSGGGVYVDNNGTFTMADGTISENTGDGGVYVAGGTFTMADGTISGNSTSNNGGGVFVGSNGAFTMADGTISGNTAGSGGGVFVYNNGTFTMEGGTIRGNTARPGSGGGVYVYNNGTFTMADGTISGNSASNNGGGVYVASTATFTMEGGTISGNTAGSGGGVFVDNNGAFTMADGTISGNTARDGGGVFVNSTATFTMEGGTISGNTARNGSGGGVYVAGGTFTKRGMSTIDAINQAANEGKVVYVYDGSKTKARNSAAGPNVDMDSRIDGRAGGWE